MARMTILFLGDDEGKGKELVAANSDASLMLKSATVEVNDESQEECKNEGTRLLRISTMIMRTVLLTHEGLTNFLFFIEIVGLIFFHQFRSLINDWVVMQVLREIVKIEGKMIMKVDAR